MKAVLLVDKTGSNPGYNRDAARAARRAGKEYNVKPKIVYRAGTEIEHPHCWIHCCTAVPTMKPADEECREAVRRFLENPQRQAQLAQLRQMAKPEVLKELPPELQDYVRALAGKWLTDSSDNAADQTDNPDGKAKTAK